MHSGIYDFVFELNKKVTSPNRSMNLPSIERRRKITPKLDPLIGL